MLGQGRGFFGKMIGKSPLRTMSWSFMVGFLATAVWLSFEHTAQAEKSPPAPAVTGLLTERLPIAPLVQPNPIMQLATVSQPTTILFMGTDVVYRDAKRRRVDSGSCQGNTDTIMLVFLNPAHNTVSVLHIPRDTEANIGKRGLRKINSANPTGGPELAKTAVSSLLGVPIDHYAVMNIHGLVELVNELGGITVEVPKKMNYMDWTAKLKIDLQPGFHTLTGNQAMGFVRFRHDALGDIGRVQRQQIFLQAGIRKMLDPASWLHLKSLVEIAQRNTRTDMSNVELFQAINFMHSVPRENTRFVMLPGDFGGNGDWIANTDGKALAQRLANPDQETITSRRNITVCIVDASPDRKLGSQLSRSLRKLGYITRMGKEENEPVSNKTKIIAQNGNIANAKMLQDDLGGSGEVVNASVGNLKSSITIVAHNDIKLDKISMSSLDAPCVTLLPRPQPLVAKPLPKPLLTGGLVKQSGKSFAQKRIKKDRDDNQQAEEPIVEDSTKLADKPAPAKSHRKSDLEI